MKTVRGIYYDLSESNYIYSINGYDFYFSSEFYLNKFKESLPLFIKNEKSRLKARYKLNFNCEKMLTLAYYIQIEKRGFYVKYSNSDVTLKKYEEFLIV